MRGTPASRPWRRALAWLALLGPLFFATYGFANTMAARRANVPSVVFDWESAVPFWPWTIVPYWSIDLFYAASLFVCRDRRELDTHALRLLTAQALAVACFLLWPLCFSFPRPEVEGAFGALFDLLYGFDKPFNQAPSLHIVLLVILWMRFARHAKQGWRWLLHGWFALIGVSVLTTYQHHFIDIPTGLLAGWLCVWMWPEGAAPPWRSAAWARDPVRWRLAWRYAAGSASCVALAWSLRGAALWLLWPAVSLLLVAANYALLGAAGFQKRADGRIATAACWLFAPYLLAAWINSRWWTRHAPQPVRVAGDVWLGRIPGRGERDGFAHVVDVCAELPLRDRRPGDVVVPMLDLVAPSPDELRVAARAIETACADGSRVLVYCALGYSRSAAAVAAWMLHSGRATSVEGAVAQVRRARAAVVLEDAHWHALQRAFVPGWTAA